MNRVIENLNLNKIFERILAPDEKWHRLQEAVELALGINNKKENIRIHLFTIFSNPGSLIEENLQKLEINAKYV